MLLTDLPPSSRLKMQLHKPAILIGGRAHWERAMASWCAQVHALLASSHPRPHTPTTARPPSSSLLSHPPPPPLPTSASAAFSVPRRSTSAACASSAAISLSRLAFNAAMRWCSSAAAPPPPTSPSPGSGSSNEAAEGEAARLPGEVGRLPGLAPMPPPAAPPLSAVPPGAASPLVLVPLRLPARGAHLNRSSSSCTRSWVSTSSSAALRPSVWRASSWPSSSAPSRQGRA